MVRHRGPGRGRGKRVRGLPQTALRAGGVDDVRIRGVNGDRRDAAADGRESRAGRRVRLAVRKPGGTDRDPRGVRGQHARRSRISRLAAEAAVLSDGRLQRVVAGAGGDRPRRVGALAVEPLLEGVGVRFVFRAAGRGAHLVAELLPKRFVAETLVGELRLPLHLPLRCGARLRSRAMRDAGRSLFRRRLYRGNRRRHGNGGRGGGSRRDKGRCRRPHVRPVDTLRVLMPRHRANRQDGAADPER